MADDERCTLRYRFAHPELGQDKLNEFGLPQPLVKMHEVEVGCGDKDHFGDTQLHVSWMMRQYATDDSSNIADSTEQQGVVNHGTTHTVHTLGIGLSPTPLTLVGSTFRVAVLMENSVLFPLSLTPNGSYDPAVSTDVNILFAGGKGAGAGGLVFGLKSVTSLRGIGSSFYSILTIGIEGDFGRGANGNNTRGDTPADWVAAGFGLATSMVHARELASISRALFDLEELRSKKDVLNLTMDPIHYSMMAAHLRTIARDKGGRLWGVDSVFTVAGGMTAAIGGSQGSEVAVQLGSGMTAVGAIDMIAMAPSDPSTQEWTRVSTSLGCMLLTGLVVPKMMTGFGKEISRSDDAVLSGFQGGCSGQFLSWGVNKIVSLF